MVTPFLLTLPKNSPDGAHSVLYLYFADNSSSPDADPASWPGAKTNLQIEGVHLPIKFSKHSLLTRRKADVAFGKAVAARILTFRPDVVLSGNTPLDSQKVIQRVSKRAKSKFIFWQQDVYYLAVRYVIKKKLRMLSYLAGAYYEQLEKKLLKKSDGVICIAPEFTKLVTDWGVEPSRVFTIENWAALDDVSPMDKDNEWSRAHGVDRKFCFMYSGTLGMKHRPELLLALARYLETIDDACLIVVAGGTGADWLRENAQTVRKDVLTLLPFQPYKRVSEVLGASDVLIALLDSEASTFAVPSKILCYLCAGRPLILAAPRDNHAASVVEQSGAGMVISPDQAEELLDAAKSLIENSKLRVQYASNARAYANRSFNIASIADRFLDSFSKI